MTNRDLLKEAIADAKAVKETAIENAKAALEEAFTPHLKSMLSSKLEEMDKEDDKVSEMAHGDKDDEKVDEMAHGKKKEKKVEEYGSMKKYEEDDKDAKNEGKHKDSEEDLEEMDAVSFRRKNSPSHNADPEGGPVNPVPHKAGKSTVQEEEIEEEELDLDEIIADLDEDENVEEELSDKDKKEIDREVDAVRDDLDQISKLAKDAGEDAEDIKDKVDEEVSEGKHKDDDDKMEEAKHADDKEDVKEDARTDAEEEGYLDGMADEKEDMEDDMDDEEVDLEDMSEDDLKGFIEDVIKDMIKAGEIEGDVEDDMEVEDEEDVDVDVEIEEEASEEVNEEEVEEGHSRVKGEKGPGNEDGDKDDTAIEKETERMRFKDLEEELRDALNQINELRDELNEINLLNAKLLYTNKIFKDKNLTENKKVKVLKAFDKAKDVKQAKTIYETLKEGVLDKSSINENKVKGSASKATGLEPTAKKPIIESNEVYTRMRQLAGLL